MTIRILAISGSLREASSNTILLRAAIALAPSSVEMKLYEGLNDLPHFNPDLEPTAPASVKDLTLIEIVTTMAGRVLPEANVTVALLGTQRSSAEILADPKLAGDLRGAINTFTDRITELRGICDYAKISAKKSIDSCNAAANTSISALVL
jgi:NADPH-dependent FMN reductase